MLSSKPRKKEVLRQFLQSHDIKVILKVFRFSYNNYLKKGENILNRLNLAVNSPLMIKIKRGMIWI